MPHLPGQSETTPGSMGQKYSVSAEMACDAMLSVRVPRVNRSQWLRITSQRPTRSAATTSTIGMRSRTCDS